MAYGDNGLCLRSYWAPWAGLKLTMVFVSGRKQVTHHDMKQRGIGTKAYTNKDSGRSLG